MDSPERLAPTRFHRLCHVAAHVPSTMLEQRCRVRVLEFDECADRRLTGQAEIRLQSVAESFELHVVPRLDVQHVQSRRRQLVELACQQTSRRLGVGDQRPPHADDIEVMLTDGRQVLY